MQLILQPITEHYCNGISPNLPPARALRSLTRFFERGNVAGYAAFYFCLQPNRR